MTRARARSTAFACAALGLATATCTPTPNILPSNDLNRPTDIAFMCLGAFPNSAGTYDVSGRPMRVCHPQLDPADQSGMRATAPGAKIDSRTFAFVPNSASGDLSVIDGDTWHLVDLDKATGGYGRAPLGTLPEQISTTTDGCRLVSANRGSCDLSLVNPSTLLAPLFAAQFNNQGQNVSINVPQGNGNGFQRVVPTRDDGTPLGAAPYEAVFLPVDTTLPLLPPDPNAPDAPQMEDKTANLCPGDNAQPATPWRALVTFPSCDLIALIDLPSGNIVASAQAIRNGDVVGLSDAGTHPTCPAECGGDRGGATTPLGTARPTSIAITPHGDLAYVSFAEVPAVLSLQLSLSTLAAGPKVSIPLHDGAMGSNRIRLGVDPYSFVTTPFDFPGVFVGNKLGRRIAAHHRHFRPRRRKGVRDELRRAEPLRRSDEAGPQRERPVHRIRHDQQAAVLGRRHIGPALPDDGRRRRGGGHLARHAG
jgi:hypothetical protein